MLKKYISPEVQVFKVVLESSIAVGSAKATFIGTDGDNSPTVDTWDGSQPAGGTDPFPQHIENW